MFEESLIESTALLQTRNRWPTVISVGIQAVIAATIVAIPLLHPEVIKLHAPSMTLFAPPLPHQTPPPPQRIHVNATNALAASAPAAAAPASAPSPIARIDSGTYNPDSSDAPPANPLALGMGNSDMPLGSSSGSGSSPHIVVEGSGSRGPLNISRGVSNGMLLEPIHPEYPQIARATHTEGIVIVQAIISKTGVIESAHVISGPSLLQGAALAAVRSAHYRPYLLNDKPTEVETTFSISFKISS
jgi:periplasmic protein TonB